MSTAAATSPGAGCVEEAAGRSRCDTAPFLKEGPSGSNIETKTSLNVTQTLSCYFFLLLRGLNEYDLFLGIKLKLF